MVVLVPVPNQVADPITMVAMRSPEVLMEISMSMPYSPVPVVVADGWPRGVPVVEPLR